MGNIKLYDLNANKYMYEQKEGTNIKSLLFNPTYYKFSVASDDDVIKTYDF